MMRTSVEPQIDKNVHHSPDLTTSSVNNKLKWLSLFCLVSQNAAVALVMRKTRTQSTEMFIASTAVVMQELLKLITCVVLVLIQSRGVFTCISALNTQIIKQPFDTLKVAVPSFIYVIQNNLLYVAITHLSAATFQITYQLKILTTALFSVILLKRTLSNLQWFSLAILFVGVGIVQLQQQAGSGSGEKSAIDQNPMLGLVAVLVACVMSGFSGVYFEKILKGSDVSIWIRNIQLSLISLPIAGITLLIQDSTKMKENGFFYGYHLLVWVSIIIQGLGGLLVAVVVKYADNILKGFATSLSILLSCIGSVYFFHFHVTIIFSIGALLVLIAMVLYSKKQFTTFNKKLPPIKPNLGS